MSDKHLTEEGWKAFSKGKDFKDAALVKALSAFAKCRDKPADQRLAAADELDKQADALLRLVKADKEAQRYLAELQSQLDAERKAAQKEKDAAAEPEDSDVFSKGVLSHLKALTPDGKTTRHFVIGVAGARTAVLLSRQPNLAGGKRQVQEFLGEQTVKYLDGEVRLEAEVPTFVLEKGVPGLAKRIGQALLAQSGKRTKVRVRGLDPGDVDEDLDDAVAAATAAATAAPASAAPEPAPPPPPPPPPPAAPSAAQLVQAMNQLTPRIKSFIEAQPARKDALLRAVAALQTLVKNQSLDEARRQLEAVLALLREPAPASGGAASAATSAAPPVDEAARKAIWDTARQAWMDAVEQVDARISQVSAAMRGSGDPELEQIAELGLPALTSNHKTPVMRALFDVDRATGDARTKAAAQARTAIAAFRQHLQSYELLAALDQHSAAAFGIDLGIRATIGGGLDQLSNALDRIATQ